MNVVAALAYEHIIVESFLDSTQTSAVGATQLTIDAWEVVHNNDVSVFWDEDFHWRTDQANQLVLDATGNGTQTAGDHYMTLRVASNMLPPQSSWAIDQWSYDVEFDVRLFSLGYPYYASVGGAHFGVMLDSGAQYDDLNSTVVAATTGIDQENSMTSVTSMI